MEQLFTIKGDANMENTKKYNRKRTLDITVMAMVLAIRLVMEMLPAITFGLYVKIGFGFIGAAIAGVMLGPWRAALVGILVDILGNFFSGKSGQFFIGYTFTALVGGLIYGYFLYKRPLRWEQIFIAVVVVTIFCNIGLNSIWVYMTSGKAFAVFMPMRILKNMISLPLNTAILTVLFSNKTMKTLIEKYRV
jgi:membrane protein